MLVDLTYTASAFEALDVELPAEFRRAHAALATAGAVATSNPAETVLEDFRAGMTPEELAERVQAAALALTAQQNAHQIIRDLQSPLAKHARAAVRENGDALIRAMRKKFDHAAKAMNAAAGLFPAQSSAEDVLRLGSAAAAAWGQLAEASRVLNLVHAARMAMAGYGTYSDPEHRVLMYVADVRDPQSLAVAADAFDRDGHRAGPGGRWHALAAAGFKLRLNTAAEMAALEQALAAANELAAQAA
jgi:hypothetical protein